ncbi:MAG: two pore domain potassium channel family protein [Bacteriovoracaceae bacterium]|nr:two pore domain potassium channel family protein [Bacteriovoracaceae bacterium]
MTILTSLKIFFREIKTVISTPTFIILTILGNALIGTVGFIFFWLEQGINPNLHSLIDAIWWAFATATTTGYGDIVPISTAGKIVGIFLMLVGTALFAMFTGLFAEAILTNEHLGQNKKD